MRNDAVIELSRFHDEVVDIYGYMVQVNMAIMQWKKLLNALISASSTTPDNTMFFGDGDPTRPGAKYQYQARYRQLIDASGERGLTSILHRRSVIVFLVASWEDNYRARIAKECGITKNELKSDVFHDLNKYRQAILHAGGKLRAAPKAIDFFGNGDTVELTNSQMDSIFRLVVHDLNRIGQVHYDADFAFTFDKALNS